MKKAHLLISMLLMVAVVLSACGGANNGNGNIGEGTPGAVDTTPGAGVNETPITGGEVDVTPTLAVTDIVEATPTTAEGVVDATATPAEGVAADTTPTAAVPVTGVDNECNPYLLRNYLEFEVVDNTGNLIGEVDGIVIYRDAALGSGAAGTDAAGSDAGNTAAATPTVAGGTVGGIVDATPTVAGGAADTTPTAAADASDGAAAGMNAVDFAAPMVAYVILDLDDASNMGDQDVVVPFSALTAPEANLPIVAGGTGDNTGEAGTGTDDPTATQSADEAAATPTLGVDDQGNIVETACVLTFSGDLATLQGAPALENDNWPDFTVDGWDEEFNTYWTTTGGFSVDFAGPNGEAMGSPVVLRDGFDDIDVENATGDDIGEIEDFVIDSATGRFQYAVLAAGGFLGIGEKYIPIPVNQILWGNFDDDIEDMGEVVINVPEDAWDNAPSFDNLDIIDFTSDAWHSDVDTYWVDLNPVQ